MKNVLILLLCLLCSSCMTVQRIQRNCDKFMQVCVQTDTRIVYRDTVIYRTVEVKLPADTVKIVDTVRVIDNVAYLPEIIRRYGLITTRARVDNSILYVTSYLNDSTILKKDTIYLQGAIREVEKWNTVTEKYIPAAYKWAFWTWVILIAVGVVFLFFKFKIPIINLIKKII